MGGWGETSHRMQGKLAKAGAMHMGRKRRHGPSLQARVVLRLPTQAPATLLGQDKVPTGAL